MSCTSLPLMVDPPTLAANFFLIGTGCFPGPGFFNASSGGLLPTPTPTLFFLLHGGLHLDVKQLQSPKTLQQPSTPSAMVLMVPVGAISAGVIMETYGRLNAIRLGAIPAIIGWIMIASGRNFTVLLIGRMFTGVSSENDIGKLAPVSPDFSGSLKSLRNMLNSYDEIVKLSTLLNKAQLSKVLYCSHCCYGYLTLTLDTGSRPAALMVSPMLFAEYWILLLKVLSSRNNVLNCYRSNALVPQDLPRAAPSPDIERKMTFFVLAYHTFDTPAPIDILLGADLFAQIMTGEQYILGKDLPIAFSTIFGVVLVELTPYSTPSELQGEDTIEDALLHQDELTKLGKLGGLEVRKWSSNTSQLIDSVSQDHRETHLYCRTPEQPLLSILELQINLRPYYQRSIFTTQGTKKKRNPEKLNVRVEMQTCLAPKDVTATTVFATLALHEMQQTQKEKPNIRQQMALSLERMKELEDQVKLIPIFQVQLSVLKEEKRKLLLQIRAEEIVKINRANAKSKDDKRLGINTRSATNSPVPERLMLVSVTYMCSGGSCDYFRYKQYTGLGRKPTSRACSWWRTKNGFDFVVQ
uniref:Uncharacterized protein n=1 Tax=Timema tahoe TaxID=61484 RepID=A0A7R9IIN7_9NEOP|nr:unnamed protein product [Timema tahoe]